MILRTTVQERERESSFFRWGNGSLSQSDALFKVKWAFVGELELPSQVFGHQLHHPLYPWMPPRKEEGRRRRWCVSTNKCIGMCVAV